MRIPPTETSIAIARLSADEATVRRLTTQIEERFEGVAVSAFEHAPGWRMEVVLHPDLDCAELADLVSDSVGPVAELTFESVAETDWIRTSLEGLQPVRAGRIFVHGAHDRHRVPINAIGVEIEAALAFGTGHHGTTRGCLLALDRLAKGGHLRRVLDVGTGTGVLAIAASRMLHRPVLATDIDPVAVRTARDNAAHNRTGPWMHVGLAGREADRIGKGFDLILANILAKPLAKMSAALARRLAPGGVIVLSGLLPAQAPLVVAAYRAQGLALEKKTTLEDWVTLVMRRRSHSRTSKRERPGT